MEMLLTFLALCLIGGTTAQHLSSSEFDAIYNDGQTFDIDAPEEDPGSTYENLPKYDTVPGFVGSIIADILPILTGLFENRIENFKNITEFYNIKRESFVNSSYNELSAALHKAVLATIKPEMVSHLDDDVCISNALSTHRKKMLNCDSNKFLEINNVTERDTHFSNRTIEFEELRKGLTECNEKDDTTALNDCVTSITEKLSAILKDEINDKNGNFASEQESLYNDWLETVKQKELCVHLGYPSYSFANDSDEVAEVKACIDKQFGDVDE